MTTFLASGSDILQGANVNTMSNTGQDSAGQISVTGGSQVFSDQSIVEFTVDPVSPDGELTTSSGFTQIVVYATQADYEAGIPTYTYAPQNAGQKAGVQDSIDRMGDDYVRFGANILTSSDPGAPALQELFVAPGSNVANQSNTTFDHHTDQDFDNSGSADAGTAEDGNGRFNVNSGQSNGPVCFTFGSFVQTPRGPVPIETLVAGDLVSTVDNGAQPVLWISTRHLGPAHLMMRPQDRPVVIGKGVLGATANTCVSPQHCLLVRPDLLMPAKKIIGLPGSRARIAWGKWQVTYIHLLFERHEVIWVNGIRAESLYPGPQCRKDLSPRQRRAMRMICPALPQGYSKQGTIAAYGPTARRVSKGINRHRDMRILHTID